MEKQEKLDKIIFYVVIVIGILMICCKMEVRKNRNGVNKMSLYIGTIIIRMIGRRSGGKRIFN